MFLPGKGLSPMLLPEKSLTSMLLPEKGLTSMLMSEFLEKVSPYVIAWKWS